MLGQLCEPPGGHPTQVGFGGKAKVSPPRRLLLEFLQPLCNQHLQSVSKQTTLSSFRINTYEKQGRGAPPLVERRGCNRTALGGQQADATASRSDQHAPGRVHGCCS